MSVYYATVNKNEPVLAGPPRRLYRFRKLVRRNKVAFFAAGSVAAALAVGLAVSIWLLSKEREARKIAASEAIRSEHVARFLKKMLEGAGPAKARGRDTTILREILGETAAQLGRDLKDEPDVEAELRLTIGQVYSDLNEFGEAEKMLREALRLRLGVLDSESKPVADAHSELGRLLWRRGENSESEKHHREALRIRRKLFGEGHSEVDDSLSNLAIITHAAGNTAGSEDLFRQLLKTREILYGPSHRKVADALTNLAGALHGSGKLEECENRYRAALDIYEKTSGREHTDYAEALSMVAMVLHERGKLVEAQSLYAEALGMQRRLLGPGHLDVAHTLNNFGNLLKDGKHLDESERVLREALAIREKLKGSTDRDVAVTLTNLGETLRMKGLPEEAEHAFRRSADILSNHYRGNTEFLAITLAGLGAVLGDRGEREKAGATLDRALILVRSHSFESPVVPGLVVAELADIRIKERKYREAEVLLDEANSRLRGDVRNELAVKRRIVDLLIYLYVTWDLNEPDAAKGAKAETWKQAFEKLDKAARGWNLGILQSRLVQTERIEPPHEAVQGINQADRKMEDPPPLPDKPAAGSGPPKANP